MSTFVSVGNSRYRMQRLLRAVCRCSEYLPQPVFVQNGHTPFSCPGVKSCAFMSQPQFEQCLINADVVVLHGGGGSILQANRLGKIPVVVPRRAGHHEHVDDHQFALCQRLEEMGKVVLLEEPDRLIEAVTHVMTLPSAGRPQTESSRMFELVDAALQAVTKDRA